MFYKLESIPRLFLEEVREREKKERRYTNCKYEEESERNHAKNCIIIKISVPILVHLSKIYESLKKPVANKSILFEEIPIAIKPRFFTNMATITIFS